MIVQQGILLVSREFGDGEKDNDDKFIIGQMPTALHLVYKAFKVGLCEKLEKL